MCVCVYMFTILASRFFLHDDRKQREQKSERGGGGIVKKLYAERKNKNFRFSISFYLEL